MKYEQIFEKQIKREGKSKRSSHLRRRGGDLRMMGDMVRPAGHQIVLLLEVLHDGMHVPVLASVHWKLRHLQQAYRRNVNEISRIIKIFIYLTIV